MPQHSATTARPSGVSPEEYAAYIGPNVTKYLPRFLKFETLPGKFQATWHWPAAIFTYWWLLYRKMYFWAALAFVLSFVPWLNIILNIGFGASGYWLYYNKALGDIRDLRAASPLEDWRLYLRDAGGVHGWVKWLAAVLFFLQPLFMIMVALLWGGLVLGFILSVVHVGGGAGVPL